MDNIKVSMINIAARAQRKIVDFSEHKGPELTQLYFNLDLFNSLDMNAAAMIGIPAIADISRLKLPLGPIMDQLPQIIYEGVVFLAMDMRNWTFNGQPEGIHKAREWMTAGPNSARRHRIEQMLGIFERPANRYLAINLLSERTSFTDIGAEFDKRRRRTTVVLDAHAFADNVQLAEPGPLFLLKVNEA